VHWELHRRNAVFCSGIEVLESGISIRRYDSLESAEHAAERRNQGVLDGMLRILRASKRSYRTRL
jgi:hypothetical protein